MMSCGAMSCNAELCQCSIKINLGPVETKSIYGGERITMDCNGSVCTAANLCCFDKSNDVTRVVIQ